MNQALLIFILIIGISFIVFGILVLFFPEVIEGNKVISSAKTQNTTKKKESQGLVLKGAFPSNCVILGMH
jgi:hypothetical protein